MRRETCAYEGCTNKPRSKDLCNSHKNQLKKNGTLKPLKAKPGEFRTCLVDGCETKHEAQGYCMKHYCMARTYGIDPQWYEDTYAEQEGRCCVCNDFAKRLQIDHDHQTGKVRGLLCGTCNKTLGLAKDDTERLIALAAYVIQNTEVMCRG